VASTRPAVVLEQLGLEEAALGDARRRVLVPGLNEATVSITNRIVAGLDMVDACTVDSAVRPRIRKGVRTCPPLDDVVRGQSASALLA